LMETSKDVHELQVDDFENIQLKVIDFGASIDLNSFPDQQTFSISVDSSNGTDEYFECWEFRHGKEWIYEPDWFQVAGILHLLLFGKILRVKETKSDNEKPDISITNKLDDDEYKELWQHTFKALLNYQSTFDDESENKIKELESLLISRK
jgi:checkpoint serine/threonine-protein kinase